MGKSRRRPNPCWKCWQLLGGPPWLPIVLRVFAPECSSISSVLRSRPPVSNCMTSPAVSRVTHNGVQTLYTTFTLSSKEKTMQLPKFGIGDMLQPRCRTHLCSGCAGHRAAAGCARQHLLHSDLVDRTKPRRRPRVTTAPWSLTPANFTGRFAASRSCSISVNGPFLLAVRDNRRRGGITHAVQLGQFASRSGVQ